ncbi:MAG: ABC transporter permease [Desulfobacula sp.]
MMMIRNIITLTVNDLAIAFKNKSIFLILFIPFFVYISLMLVDEAGVEIKRVNIGLIQSQSYPPVILEAIQSAGKLFTILSVSSEEEGNRWLKEKKIDGLLLRPEKEKISLVLVVLKKESVLSLQIVESFSALQKAVEGNNINWISDIKPLQEGGIQRQTLPTWILMLVMLVSFIIMPAQIAEEKEKKLLLALLQTPMREIEWLTAKLFLGMILIFIAVLFLHLMGRFDFGNVLSYIAFIGVGSFCFSAYGILLGFFCQSQAGARTLGVIFYLPHLLPSALSEFSQKLSAVAPFLPSYPFFESVKSILLDDSRISTLFPAWCYLLFIGLLTFFISYLLMKKRWRM